MAKVIFNQELRYREAFYQECLGATKPRISIRKEDLNLDIITPNKIYEVSMKIINDSKTPTIILTTANQSDETYLIYVPDDKSYSQNVIVGTPLWSASTSNKLGEKTIFLFKLQDVIIREGTYKERRPAYYVGFDVEQMKWRALGTKADVIENANDRLAKKLIEVQGWTQNTIEL